MDQYRDAEYAKIDLLQRILAELQREDTAGEAMQLSTQKLTERIMEIASRDESVKWMLAAALPSTPATSMEVTVPTTTVMLYENQSEPLLRVTISNDDLAQSIWVGPEGVNINIGERINGRDWRAFVMPSGTALYAVTDVGAVSARVALGYNIKRLMDAIFRELS